jgi:hypothetical protein
MRWLIEFVGLTEDKHGKPCKKPKGRDTSIENLPGGVAVDPKSPDAAKLARVWKGCTQGSGHPTHESQHPPVNEPEVAEALRIIIQHLDKTIYAGETRKVVEVALQPPG